MKELPIGIVRSVRTEEDGKIIASVDLITVRNFEKNWRTIWIGSEQREDAEWYTVAAFIVERNAKLWMYEASNRAVEEVELKDAD